MSKHLKIKIQSGGDSCYTCSTEDKEVNFPTRKDVKLRSCKSSYALMGSL